MKMDKTNLNNEREITKHLKLKFKHNFEDKKIIERFFKVHYHCQTIINNPISRARSLAT